MGFLLAHHDVSHLDRCYQLWACTRPIWICARCLGVYPTLFLALGIQVAIEVPRGWWDLLLLFGLPIPALVDWAGSRLRSWPGSNPRRTLTGMLLGLSLSRMVYLNMVHPFQLLVSLQILLLMAVVLIVEGGARLRSSRRGAGQ
jgi:uncharacterized membrane protein